MNIKFEESELSGASYLGEGTHECVVSKIQHGVSRNKGVAQIEVEFLAANGKTARDFMITAGNKFRLASLALACGFPKDVLLSGGFSAEMLIGRRVKVVKSVVGKDPEGKNKYEQSYLPSSTGDASVTRNEGIPF